MRQPTEGEKPSWLPYIASGSLYKHAEARHGLPVRVRQILSKYEMKRMALAISVPNLAGTHQPILKLYQTAHHPALPLILAPVLGASVWRVSFAHPGFPHMAKALAWVGCDVRGEVWFGSLHKGIPPILTILHCSLKLHDIWVMLLI